MTRRMYLPVCAAALAPVLLVSAMVAKADTSYPAKGMTMAQVARTFGHPLSKSAPSGLPPIVHWVYDGFTVYFDHDRVIFHIKRSSAANEAKALAIATKKPRLKKHPGKAARPAAVAALPLAAEPVEALPAPVAAAPVAAPPAPTPAPAAAPVASTSLADLVAAEKARKAAQPSAPQATEMQVVKAAPVSNEPMVKAVTPMQVMRAGLVRVFHEDSGLYAGVAGGTGNFSNFATAQCNGGLVANGFAPGSCGKATGDSAFKVYAGYNFSPLLALEGDIIQLGSSNYATTVNQTGIYLQNEQIGITGKVSARALNANMVVNFHPAKIEKLTVGVKLGGYMAFNDITSTATGNGVNRLDNISHSFVNGSSMLGLVVSYKLFHGLAAQAEWNRFRDLGLTAETSSRDVDVLFAGLKYTF